MRTNCAKINEANFYYGKKFARQELIKIDRIIKTINNYRDNNRQKKQMSILAFDSSPKNMNIEPINIDIVGAVFDYCLELGLNADIKPRRQNGFGSDIRELVICKQ